MSKLRVAALAACICAFSTPAFAQSSAALPADLQVVRPANNVPKPCAAFSGGWRYVQGFGDRALEIWVERISAQCEAAMIYAWGEDKGSRIVKEAGYRRISGRIENGTLKFDLTDFKGRGEYQITGSQLSGVFVNMHGTPIRGTYNKIK